MANIPTISKVLDHHLSYFRKKMRVQIFSFWNVPKVIFISKSDIRQGFHTHIKYVNQLDSLHYNN